MRTGTRVPRSIGGNDVVDLETHQFGPYRYYVQNINNSDPCHDHYYNQIEFKNPMLFNRAREFTKSIQSEPSESRELFGLRRQTLPGQPHRGIYDRKRRRKLEPYIPQRRLSYSEKSLLLVAYPTKRRSNRQNKWNILNNKQADIPRRQKKVNAGHFLDQFR